MGAEIEHVLRAANEQLADVSGAYIDNPAAAKFRWPPCFIIAPPRGASTLLQQVLISRFKLGYVSNVMARFWKAPVVGAAVQISIMDPTYISTYRSRYGNTEGPLEPHEFGWFWRHTLGLAGDDHHITQPVDWGELKRTFIMLERLLDGPLIFDSPFVCANLAEIAAGIGQVLALDLRRSPWHICNSILNARKERYGDINHFYGARPLDFHSILSEPDPVVQTVRQAASLAAETDNGLAVLPASHVLQIDYETLRAAPLDSADRVAAFLTRHGPAPKRKKVEIGPFPDRNAGATVDSVMRDRLDEVFAAYFPGAPIPPRGHSNGPSRTIERP